LALVHLLVYGISHKVIADVDLNIVDAGKLVDVLMDIWCYLEAKEACKSRIRD
jgi:hypothetical protein